MGLKSFALLGLLNSMGGGKSETPYLHRWGVPFPYNPFNYEETYFIDKKMK
ncbi:hypothetical protein Barb4_02270 [Bacteroidales bacterium Barb4]|nr:hypothetical protein Barb4_02270 [Bacteroidales bacterium Barb4]